METFSQSINRFQITRNSYSHSDDGASAVVWCVMADDIILQLMHLWMSEKHQPRGEWDYRFDCRKSQRKLVWANTASAVWVYANLTSYNDLEVNGFRKHLSEIRIN